jgi:hypothetical protein
MIRRPLLRRLEACRATAARAPDEAEAGYMQLLAEMEGSHDIGFVLDLHERAADELATLQLRAARLEDAARTYRRLLGRSPTSLAAHAALARLVFPGDEYKLVLAAIHAALRPGFYLEIGVSAGDSLRLAHPATFACGVDPQPDIKHVLGPNMRVLAETSDAFFARYAERPAFASRLIDLAFLDGLHTFDQTLRDFINVERRAAPGAIVMIHDCIPLDAVVAARERRSAFWTGDVWKILPILWARRPDLDIAVVGAEPSGLVVVRKLDPRSDLLDRDFDALVAAHMGLGYEDYVREVQPRIRLIRSDSAAVARALQAGAPL